MAQTIDNREIIASLELRASSNLSISINELPVQVDQLPLALQLYLKADEKELMKYSLQRANYSTVMGGLLRNLNHGETTYSLLENEFDLQHIEKGRPMIIFFQGFVSIMPQFSLCMPWLRPGFAGKNIINQLSEMCSFSSLLVRDSMQLWYLAGPLGCTDFKEGFHSFSGLDAWSVFIYRYIRQCSPSKIIVCGTSAGGTAAIVLGSLIGADSIISISPQGRLFDLVWEKQIPYAQYTNLCPWRFAAAGEFGISTPISIKNLVKDNKGSKVNIIVPRGNAGDCAALAHISQDLNTSV